MIILSSGSKRSVIGPSGLRRNVYLYYCLIFYTRERALKTHLLNSELSSKELSFDM
jgi:hypothetical protein